MINKLFIYIQVLIFALSACNQKKDDPQPNSGGSDGYAIISIAPLKGKVGEEIVITTNQIENVSKIIFNGVETAPHAITNTEIKVNIPEYATRTGKIVLEVEDKDLKAESSEDFTVEYPANQLAHIGGKTRFGATGFTIGTKLYMGLGNATNDFWEYDTETNAWKQIADFPGGARSFATSFVINNKGYVGTGKFQRSSPSAPIWYTDLWEYDPSIDQWTKKADFPGTARTSAVGFSIAGKGYIGTGDANDGSSNLGAQEDFWSYDPTTDQWTRIANFGGRYVKGAVSFVIDSKAYVGTGNNGMQGFWQYDPATDQWTKKADFGGGKRSGAIGFTSNNKGYIGLGGNAGETGYKQDIWQYDPTTDQWTKVADFEGGARSWATAFSVGNKVYIGSGFGQSLTSANYTSKKDFWAYKF
ncbi:MAG TPA: hypothetical protein DCS93_23845 [Microscillaceae bacterium]|nr:hypothetical protein [Microscillaceae bacterium]